jgi:hypothetical protein
VRRSRIAPGPNADSPNTDGHVIDTAFLEKFEYAGTAHHLMRTSRAGPTAGSGCLPLIMPRGWAAASVQQQPAAADPQLAPDPAAFAGSAECAAIRLTLTLPRRPA